MVIGEVRSARGYYTAYEAIPGHTIGGAVNRALFGKSYPPQGNAAKMFIASTAYPVFDNRESFPAHPFYYECKVCDNLIFSTLEKESLLQAIKGGLKDVKDKLVALECDRHHPLKSLHPRPLVHDSAFIKKDRLSVQPFISVGMNRHTASSQYGLLYEYTAIEPGQEYWFTLASTGNIDISEEFEVRIGRGSSRGLGRGLVKVVRKDEGFSFTQHSASEITLYALSPVPLRFLSKPINLKECAARYGLSGVDGSLEILVVEDQLMVFGKVKTMSAGWSFGSPISRNRITCVSAGSVLVCRWREKSSDPLRSMEALRYFGMPLVLDSDPVDGFCMLHTFDGEPIREVR